VSSAGDGGYAACETRLLDCTHNQEEDGGCPQEIANTTHKACHSVIHVSAASPMSNTFPARLATRRTCTSVVGHGFYATLWTPGCWIGPGRRLYMRMTPSIVGSLTTSIRTRLAHCPAGKGFVAVTRWRYYESTLTERAPVMSEIHALLWRASETRRVLRRRALIAAAKSGAREVMDSPLIHRSVQTHGLCSIAHWHRGGNLEHGLNNLVCLAC
jgi:hypothetical protein